MKEEDRGNIQKLYGKALLPYFLVGGAFVLANSRFQSTVAGYGKFNIFDVSQFIGLSYFEFMMLIIAGIAALVYHRKIFTKEEKACFNLVGLMLLIAVSSVALLSENKATGLRTTLVYLRPFIYFLLLTAMKWEKKHVKGILIFLGILFYINLVIGYYQWLALGYVVDDLHALMDDAVTFACMMYFGVLFYVSRYWMTKKKVYLLLCFLPVFPALVASTDKATMTMIPTLFISFLAWKGVTLTRILRAGGTVALIVLAVVIFFPMMDEGIRGQLSGNLDRLGVISNLDFSDIIDNIGLIRGYKNIPSMYSDYVYSPLLGLGPGQYGSVEVTAESSTDNPWGMEAYRQELEGRLFLTGAITVASSDVIVLFLEFGALFAILYTIFWKRLFDLLSLFKRKEIDHYLRTILFWLFGYLIFMSFLAFITHFDGIVRMSSTIPYFVVLGVVSSIIKGQNIVHRCRAQI